MRSTIYKIAWLLLVFFYMNTCYSQTEWDLKKDKDGIKVYTSKLQNSKFNTIKVSCKLNGSLSSLAAILLQPALQPEWVEATKTSILIKRLATNHIYYYNIVSMPWPIMNRDMVIDMLIKQDTLSKKMTIHANSIDKIKPEIPGLVRMPLSQATWEIIPIGLNRIQVEYTLKINPGGGIPAWVVNMFIAKVPFETFHSLSKIIQENRFQKQQFDFIKD